MFAAARSHAERRRIVPIAAMPVIDIGPLFPHLSEGRNDEAGVRSERDAEPSNQANDDERKRPAQASKQEAAAISVSPAKRHKSDPNTRSDSSKVQSTKPTRLKKLCLVPIEQLEALGFPWTLNGTTSEPDRETATSTEMSTLENTAISEKSKQKKTTISLAPGVSVATNGTEPESRKQTFYGRSSDESNLMVTDGQSDQLLPNLTKRKNDEDGVINEGGAEMSSQASQDERKRPALASDQKQAEAESTSPAKRYKSDPNARPASVKATSTRPTQQEENNAEDEDAGDDLQMRLSAAPETSDVEKAIAETTDANKMSTQEIVPTRPGKFDIVFPPASGRSKPLGETASFRNFCSELAVALCHGGCKRSAVEVAQLALAAWRALGSSTNSIGAQSADSQLRFWKQNGKRALHEHKYSLIRHDKDIVSRISCWLRKNKKIKQAHTELETHTNQNRINATYSPPDEVSIIASAVKSMFSPKDEGGAGFTLNRKNSRMKMVEEIKDALSKWKSLRNAEYEKEHGH